MKFKETIKYYATLLLFCLGVSVAIVATGYAMYGLHQYVMGEWENRNR